MLLIDCKRRYDIYTTRETQQSFFSGTDLPSSFLTVPFWWVSLCSLHLTIGPPRQPRNDRRLSVVLVLALLAAGSVRGAPVLCCGSRFHQGCDIVWYPVLIYAITYPTLLHHRRRSTFNSSEKERVLSTKLVNGPTAVRKCVI